MAFNTGDSFSLRISIRIDGGTGYTSGRLQLKYDAGTRNSDLLLDFGQSSTTYYLHDSNQMSTTTNSGDNTVDLITTLANKQNGDPWVEMGRWIGAVL